MLLKNIKMKGFKSFANQVKLDFEPATTGVIGPNGSGKSNIADAIRWVLGEQSAKALRGSKMKDIIFAGSEQRRPLKKAEVSLTFDNSDGELDIDYNTVTITRRVSKDGRSDYLINNNRCRLKDIKRLLLDTGMGKDAYSIIGQGKVETILNGQATDRRGLFEEAAGISKHKQRKEKAVDKLDNTKQNLQRIEDIVSEIERQLGPLEKDAKDAKKYKEFEAELEEKEVNLLLNKYANLEEKLDEKIALKQQLSYKLTNIKAEVSEYDLKINNYNDQVEKLNIEIEEDRNQLFGLKSKVESLKNKLELAIERKADLEQREDKLKNEIKSATEKIDLAKEKIEKKEKQQQETTQLLTKKKTSLEAKEEVKDKLAAKLDDKLITKEETRDNHIQQADQIKKQQYQLETVKKELNRYQQQITGLRKEKTELDAKIQKLKTEKQTEESQLTEINNKLDQYHKEFKEKEDLKEELKTKFKELDQKHTKLKKKVDNKKSRLEALQGLAENYSGYYKGVKSLLQAADNKKLAGICGVVAELIDVPKKYETAVEIALGSALQNIIVENNNVGEEAINYLKKERKGRATLLPLNLVNARSLREKEKKALKIEGAIGVATELIDYQTKYKPAIKNLLGRVIIAQNISQAVKVSKAAKQRVKVVTLDGEVVRPGGAMTGGSYNKNNNLLGRSREIEQLEQEIKKLTAQLKQVGDLGIKKKDKLVETEKSLAQVSEKIHQLEIKQTTTNKDYQQISEQVNRLQDRLSVKVSKINQFKKEISALETKKDKLVKNLNQSNITDNLETVMTKLEKEIELLEEDKEKMNGQITNLKVEIASLEQQQNQIKEDIANQEQLINQYKGEIKEKESVIKRIKEKINQLANKRTKLSSQKQKKTEQVTKIGDNLSKLQDEKKVIKQKIRQAQKESKAVREKLEKIQEEFNQVKVDLGQLKVKLGNIEDKLETEYELDIYDKLDNRVVIENYNQVEEKIKKLKKKMKSLEPVNLAAITEYKNLNKRYDFLQEQHQDLIKAKESLQQVIAEIDQEMEEKFFATFKDVKKEFETIFVDLFEGGEAELILTDRDNLLETEIEINAQPPGKKLQKLSLMSGGEKALTATALIFALLKINPSPFYILDELDAPLDDANVNRFASYLQELSDKAQFIIITHRKGTMKVLDALYGVTMEESGVSKLVSLKLNDLKDY
ncbi:chromosome segregation protein SMC [Halobacteroides halobius DSM 5150]|uniref:Chromosome partition protein Smc n=1 Tax=Halobacteroides halobius (strain ATCC 35273 / DSM 5150 / MD-1) TaxID=748449 RepID=L0K8A5_HALHC|nr:chromosome segregation protein SMC [Halobacteroides halobius]AGB40594.1 chromosome segregation protein SMC [Halobacteroides halobius DSM 5150]